MAQRPDDLSMFSSTADGFSGMFRPSLDKPTPEDWGVTSLKPWVRHRDGEMKPLYARSHSRFIASPILWRSADNDNICWTWLGAVIAADQWDEGIVPEKATFSLPWREELPEEYSKAVLSLLKEIENDFGVTSAESPALSEMRFHFSESPALHGEGIRKAWDILPLYRHLRDAISEVSELPASLREKAASYMGRLEQYLGY